MDSEDQRTIYCGNLSARVTEELLYELFLQVAPLEKVKIPTDREGRQGNYGFITCKHAESVPYAISLLNGVMLFDRRLNLKPRNNPQNVNQPVNFHGKQQQQQRSLHEMVLSGQFNMNNMGKRNHYETSPIARRPYDRRNDRQEYRRGNRYDHERHGNYTNSSYNKRRLRLSN